MRPNPVVWGSVLSSWKLRGRAPCFPDVRSQRWCLPRCDPGLLPFWSDPNSHDSQEERKLKKYFCNFNRMSKRPKSWALCWGLPGHHMIQRNIPSMASWAASFLLWPQTQLVNKQVHSLPYNLNFLSVCSILSMSHGFLVSCKWGTGSDKSFLCCLLVQNLVFILFLWSYLSPFPFFILPWSHLSTRRPSLFCVLFSPHQSF